ncbi:MAG: hypothetical protein LW708_14755 [Anabaena sp. 49628_E55]|nr:hypothetical protein [Anabaena sp. 49628_E55]
MPTPVFGATTGGYFRYLGQPRRFIPRIWGNHGGLFRVFGATTGFISGISGIWGNHGGLFRVFGATTGVFFRYSRQPRDLFPVFGATTGFISGIWGNHGGLFPVFGATTGGLPLQNEWCRYLDFEVSLLFCYFNLHKA